MDESNLFKNIVEFTRPRTIEGKDKKWDTYESAYALYEGQQLILNAFRRGIFPIKEAQGKGLKILTPKQMLQKLPRALTQVKAGNTSENLLDEISQIIFFLCRRNEITKKVFSNAMNSVIVILS